MTKKSFHFLFCPKIRASQVFSGEIIIKNQTIWGKVLSMDVHYACGITLKWYFNARPNNI